MNKLLILLLGFYFSIDLLGAQSADFSQINRIEYYIDADPGQGNGIPISFLATDTILNYTIDLDTIRSGMHILYIRVHEPGIGWSLSQQLLFNVDEVQSSNINYVEYFIDDDPGRSLAQNISFSADTSINLQETINLDTVSGGLHVLYMRARNNQGVWTLPRPYLFSMDLADASDPIQKIEYFIDSIPAYGSGISVTVTPDSTIEVNETVEISQASSGLHTFYFVAYDINGIRSIPIPFTHLVEQSYYGQSSENLLKAEYYINSDPGKGAAHTLNFSPNDSIVLDETIDLSGADLGLNTVYFRFLSENGSWSLDLAKTILVERAINDSSVTISHLEAYFDSDPGYKQATTISISEDRSIDQTSILDISGIDNGMHLLYLRALDNYGIWSLPYTMPIIVDNSDSNQQISALEYRFFKDSLLSNWQEYSFSNRSDSFHDSAAISVSALAVDSNYQIQFRVKDSSPMHSLVWNYEFDVEQGFNNAPFVFNPIPDIQLSENFGSVFLAYLPDYIQDENLNFGDSLRFLAWSSSNLTDFVIRNDSLFFGSIPHANGVFDLIIQATDDSMAVAMDTVQVFITPVNEPPQLVNPIVDLNLHEDFADQDLGNYTFYFSDSNDQKYGDQLNISFVTKQNIVTVNLVDSIIIVSAIANKFGLDTLIVTAIDDSSATISDSIFVTIYPLNDPPNKVASFNRQIILSENFTGLYEISNLNMFYQDNYDHDSLKLVFEFQSGLSFIQSEINEDTIRLTSIPQAFGSGNLIFRASDDSSSFYQDTLFVTVNEVNDPTENFTLISPVNNTVLDSHNQAIQFRWTKSKDPENQSVSYQLTILNLTDTIRINSINDSSYLYSNHALKENTNYHWYVTASDGELTTRSTEIFQFLVPKIPRLNLQIGIMQNYIVLRQLHFLIKADTNLQSNPFVRLKKNEILQDTLEKVTSSGTRFYTYSRIFTETGTYELLIDAKAVNRAKVDSSLLFQLQILTFQNSIEHIESPSRIATMRIGEQSLSKGSMLLLREKESHEIEVQADRKISSGIELDFKLPDDWLTDASKIFIYEKQGDDWIQKETQVYLKQRIVRSYVDQSTNYRILVDKNSSGSNLVPDNFALYQNYPNPFNPVTRIRYDLAENSRIQLIIFDMLGRKVKTLVDAFQLAKEGREIQWDATNDLGAKVASGIYFYKLISPKFIHSGKMILIK